MERTIGLLWHRPIHYEIGRRTSKYFSRVMWSLMILLALSGSVMLIFRHAAAQIEAVSPVSVTEDIPQTPQTESTPAVIAAENSDNELQQVIEQWISQHPGVTWGVAVEQLDGHKTTLVNADQPFAPASIYKLYAYYALTKKIPFEQWGNVTLENGQTLLDCAQVMIQKSDNPCGEAIANKLGWSTIDKLAHQAGFSGTTLNRQQGSVSTARDAVNFLQQVEEGSLISGAARDQLLTSMKAQKFRAGIPNGCIGCETFNKTGDINGYKHDAAIVHVNGHVYTLAVFSKDGNYDQIADLTRLINGYINQ